ncbi:hypothetical protein BD410DRAFT_831649 [Rickenella mellea]|uniref:TPR-like protein n=1 Tax=Rickenella mellea TaxID=50990 RepID=A0A4Y7PP28_9AGAM|nr:hypothetical protein BD410DRAFT_831649 [Rickenella mellea]
MEGVVKHVKSLNSGNAKWCCLRHAEKGDVTQVGFRLSFNMDNLLKKLDYIQAYEKYTSAIELDGTNAIIFNNRAACGKALNRMLEATSDAQMETANYIGAMTSWKQALECVPKSNLNPAEQKLKRQFNQGLKSTEGRVKAANMAAQAMHKPVPQEVFYSGDLPSDRAKAMMPEVCDRPAEDGISSAWIIHSADKLFLEGAKDMKELHKDASGRTIFKLDAIEKLSDAVLTDKRIFRIAEPNWMEKYNNQLTTENTSRGAWLGHGPKIALVMYGFFAYRLTHDYAAAVTWYNSAIELLERGRNVWKDIPNDQSGMVFMDNFLRAVRSAHLEAYFDACVTELGKFSKNYPLDRLAELADELYHDSSNPPPPDTDHASILSFYRYPAANALAMKSAELYAHAATEWMSQNDELHCFSDLATKLSQRCIMQYVVCASPTEFLCPYYGQNSQGISWNETNMGNFHVTWPRKYLYASLIGRSRLRLQVRLRQATVTEAVLLYLLTPGHGRMPRFSMSKS